MVSASGFSTKTALPVCSARQTRSAWVWWRVTMNMASSEASSSTASAVVEAAAKPNRRWALTADSELGRRDVSEPYRVQLRQMRQQHRRRVVTRADEPDRQLPGRSAAAAAPAAAETGIAGLSAARSPPGARILEQDADGRERAGGEIVRTPGGALQREDAGNERLDLEVLVGDEVEEAGEVAPLGPADVAGRIVDAVKLVAVVIAARAVRPGEPDVEFLVVVGVPGQVQAGLADVHHPRAVARQSAPLSPPDRWMTRLRPAARGRRRALRSARPAPAERRSRRRP